MDIYYAFITNKTIGMSVVRNVHIIPQEKFTKNFIKRINTEFGAENNYFYVLKNNCGELLEMTFRENVKTIEITKKNFLKIFIQILKYDKIFLHNLNFMHPYFLFFLSFLPKKIKKQYWIMWGMDLYCYEQEKKTVKEKISELIRCLYIRRLYGIIFLVKGDYDLACKWYKTKAKYFVGGYVDDNRDFLQSLISNPLKKDDEFIRIQVGNSAASRNNHIEALRKLKFVDSPNMLVYCPLSYSGTKEYVKTVINEGKILFGERFIPMLEMIPKEKYFEYLSQIDIGVFNTDRQMGLGNISTMVALGKKVYINDYTTSWRYYKDRGIEIFPFNKRDFTNDAEKEDFFRLLSEEQKSKNFEITVQSTTLFTKYWDNIFKS